MKGFKSIKEKINFVLALIILLDIFIVLGFFALHAVDFVINAPPLLVSGYLLISVSVVSILFYFNNLNDQR